MTKSKKTTQTFEEQIAQQILENYDLKNAQDIQDALKQVFGPILKPYWKGKCRITSVMKRMDIQKIQQMPVMGISRRRWKPRWAKPR